MQEGPFEPVQSHQCLQIVGNRLYLGNLTGHKVPLGLTDEQRSGLADTELFGLSAEFLLLEIARSRGRGNLLPGPGRLDLGRAHVHLYEPRDVLQGLAKLLSACHGAGVLSPFASI